MGEIAVVPNKMLLKFAVEFNNLQAATGNVDSIVTIIQDFEDYQSEAEMLHPEVKQALESMDSGFRLLKMVAQYSAGDLKIDDFDLNEMNNLLISSYKCKEIPNLFNECAIRLSKIFLQEKQFENARVLHILAIDSFKLLIENSKDPAPRKLGIETAVTSDLADQLLICEVQYLESLLLISSELVSTELCISQSTKAKKKKIGEKGLLHKMNVVENDIPHLAENLHDAKIIGEQIIQKLSEVNDAVDNTSSNQGTYYKSYVEAAQYYLISKFEPDLEKKGELLEQSIECYLTLKTEYFEAPKLQKFVDDSDGIAIGYYLHLMQNNFVNYTLLLQIKTFALVDLNAVSTNHIQSEIKAINKLLACATNNMEEYLEFMDAHPKRFDEKDKIMTIVYLGRLYRFFIVKNKSKMQEYLDKSIHFLRRFIQILKKDKEAKEFFFESHIDDDFAAMLEAGGEFECLLSLLDIIFTDPYIKKFRGDPEDNTCTVC